uniref:Uncharacterized protein n=1 Tax=viral metagenome TaxID=1070528 RepID=A0A6M3LHY7_9ZZZZ
MGAHQEITVKTLWAGVSVPAAGTTLTSDAIDMSSLSQGGYATLQYCVTGTSGASVYCAYQLSNDGVNYVYSTEGYKVAVGADGWHEDAGHGSDGRDLVRLSATLAAFMQVQVWEVNSVGANLTLALALQ